jgi:hypothetical protein
VDPARIEELVIAWEAMMVRGHAVGTRDALIQCEELVTRCRTGGAMGLEAPLRALRAKLLADVGDVRQAETAAEDAIALLDGGHLAAALPICALWLHRVFVAGQNRTEARRCLQVAANWLHRTAQEHVPAEFRDSFLGRNPVNRELLTLATRLG